MPRGSAARKKSTFPQKPPKTARKKCSTAAVAKNKRRRTCRRGLKTKKKPIARPTTAVARAQHAKELKQHREKVNELLLDLYKRQYDQRRDRCFRKKGCWRRGSSESVRKELLRAFPRALHKKIPSSRQIRRMRNASKQSWLKTRPVNEEEQEDLASQQLSQQQWADLTRSRNLQGW